MQRARAGLVFWGVITAILAVVALGAPRADAMCCSCSGLNCGGGGFCVDGVADGGACGTVCGGCGTVIFATNDVCAGGCSVGSELPTASPSATPTLTGTPTDTPTPTPTASFTASATTTGTVTSTPTITNTPSTTPTITATPTPLVCCQQSGPACGPPNASRTCVVGAPNSGQLCDGVSGNCFVPTSTFTPTQTRTVTSTPSLTATPTNTPTRTNTATVTETPEVPMSIDPYKCYRIKTTSGKPKPDTRIITVYDQFGKELNAVLRPFLMCNPAQRTKGIGATPTALQHPEAHLVCYKIKTQKDAGNENLHLPRKVVIRNKVEPGVQGIEYYDVMKSDLVCLPSTKELVP